MQGGVGSLTARVAKIAEALLNRVPAFEQALGQSKRGWQGIRRAHFWLDQHPLTQYAILATLLCILLNFLFLFAYSVGESFALDDNDFISMSQILDHSEKYAGTLLYEVSLRVREINLFIAISDHLWGWGISAQIQYSIFYFLMIFFTSLGKTVFLFTFSLPFSLRLLGVFMIPLAVFGPFGRFMRFVYYGKAIPSTIVLGLGFLALALFLMGRFRWAVLIAAVMFYFHAVHAGILMIFVMGFLSLMTLWDLLQGNRRTLKLYLQCCAICLITVPFFVQYLTNAGAVGSIDYELWLKFLTAKTSNPLPMGDGVPVVASIIAAIAVLLALWGRLVALRLQDKLDQDLAILIRGFWCVAVLLGFWCIQVYFTHWRPAEMVIKIVFTRATPYVGIFAIVATLIAARWGFRNAASRPPTAIPWVFLLLAASAQQLDQLFSAPDLAPLISDHLHGITADAFDYAIARHFDVLVFLLTALCLTLRGRGAAFAEVAAIVAAVIAILAFDGKPTYVFCLLALLSNWVVQSGYRIQILPRLRHPISPGWFLAVVVPLSIWLMLSSNDMVKRGFRTLESLGTSTTVASDAEAAAVVELLKRYTTEYDAILQVPHQNYISNHILTERAVYLGFAESQFVLYAPELIGMVVRRLENYNLDLDKILDDQYCRWADRYLWVYMCNRTIYFVRAREYNDGWRARIDDMQADMPRLRYAVIQRGHACEEDKILAETKGHYLVALKDVASAACTWNPE
ncbi:hypothetical protein [Algihabitans albus]|uniref:hypothetical protein n=1 Tax=Algihabitans albus TaxID=2164067 RepID=UPI0013C2EF7C|nr:hypothetical protein [Algihabitans albus]